MYFSFKLKIPGTKALQTQITKKSLTLFHGNFKKKSSGTKIPEDRNIEISLSV